MILALAGRRIDAAGDSPPRFPVQNIERVSRALRDLLSRDNVSALVSSAACGADLIALSEAGKLGVRRRVVLPFGRERFRKDSVVDRPGEWGGLFDAVLSDLEAMGDVVVIEVPNGADAFTTASLRILDEAVAIGKERREMVAAAMVWDGVPRGDDDYTAAFGKEARRRGIEVLEISTL